jgi:transcriptional regulator with XRE-family HTH domain
MNVPFSLVTPTALGAELRRARRARKLTQKDLASRAAIDLATVANLEAGRGTVAPLVQVLQALEHRFSYQLPDEGLGRWLARERHRRGYSQEVLCRMADLSKPSVIQIERN